MYQAGRMRIPVPDEVSGVAQKRSGYIGRTPGGVFDRSTHPKEEQTGHQSQRIQRLAQGQLSGGGHARVGRLERRPILHDIAEAAHLGGWYDIAGTGCGML